MRARSKRAAAWSGARAATIAIAVAIAIGAAPAGCAEDDFGPAGPRQDAGGGGGGDAGTLGRPTETDLPCEVADTLAAQCWTCHGPTPAGGAPTSLVSRADLAAASAVDPAQSYAERSVVRMRAATLPMPPVPPAVDEPAIAAWEAWIASGMPAGTCATTDPFGTPDTCSSGRTWTGGTRESPLMEPGGTCVSCHDREAPERRFWVGGTVYATAHEPDDCSGADTGGAAVVEITDAEGRVFEVQPNAAGNFFLMRPTSEDVPPGGIMVPALTFPYTARVRVDGRVRAMATAQASGDCNVCHTLRGDMGAPGRIMLP